MNDWTLTPLSLMDGASDVVTPFAVGMACVRVYDDERAVGMGGFYEHFAREWKGKHDLLK